MRAHWDSSVKQVTCLKCTGDIPSPAPTAAPATLAEALPPLPSEPALRAALDLGRPGASAQKEYERRHAKHEEQVEAKWGTGRLGRIAKFLSDDPQSTTAWAKGARGEELVAQVLHDHLGDRAVVLHDRKVPRTRGNIDHIAIAASGVWVIDAKRYAGLVESRDVGGFFRTDIRLYVAGRDRTKAVAGLAWQVEAVQKVLNDDAIPVHSALSFVGANWPRFFAKPLKIDGVWISWPTKLAELVLADGPLSEEHIETIAYLLGQKLPAN